jgi:hypothetical protein
MMKLKAPATLGAGSRTFLHDGTTATVDVNGYVSVSAEFTNELLTAGFIVVDEQSFAIPPYKYTIKTDTSTTAAVILPAELVAENAVIEMTGTTAGNAVVTLPTVAALAAAIPEFQDGTYIHLRIINTGGGAYSWTPVTNTGWGTLKGNGPNGDVVAVADYFFRDFILYLQNSTTGTVQAMGASLNTSA